MSSGARDLALAFVCAGTLAACDLASGLDAFHITEGEVAGGGGGNGGTGGEGGEGGQPPMMLTCNFADDFDDAALSTFWEPTVDPGLRVAVDGELVFEVPAGPGKRVASVSSPAFDASGCAISVELVEANVDAQSFVHFELWVDVDHRVGFFVIGDRLRFHHQVGAVRQNEEIPYLPNDHRFLQFRHEGMGFVWSTSANGVDWVERRTLSSDLVVGAMHVVLGTEVLPANPGAPAYEARFDNVAAGPP